jgi:hypothetical protein
LASIGFVEAKSDTSLFIYRRGDDTVFLLLYVDDIVLTASTADLLQRTIVALQREFAMKDLGPPPLPRHHRRAPTVAELPELFQLKCPSPALEARPHLNGNNPSIPRI